MDGRQALEQLKQGNERFASGAMRHPHLDAARRTDLAQRGQEPIATVLACSDSRVPVEQLFDAGVGDLFTLTVAGNVAGPTQMGTVEYAVGTLRTPLLLVLGHTRCGAVGAALEGMEAGGHLGALLQMIRPAADVARRSGATGEELAEIAAEANVRFTLRVLEHTCEPVAAAVREGSLLLAGGVYDIAAGRVRWLD